MSVSVSRRPSRSGERAMVAAQMVIVWPVLLLMILTVIQLALWYHAGSVAQVAARHGVDIARFEGGTQSTAATETDTLLRRLGGAIIVDPQVTVTINSDSATVTVSGHAQSILPISQLLSVTATAQAKVERFRPASESPP